MKLVRVVAPHFVAGFETDGNRVVIAAPILKYLIGKTEDYARHYIKQKGWVASVVEAERAFTPRPEQRNDQNPRYLVALLNVVSSTQAETRASSKDDGWQISAQIDRIRPAHSNGRANR